MKYQKAIKKSVEEFLEIYDDVSTSDLQGIVEVRAAEISKSKLYSDKAWGISERILSGIYDNV